MQIQSPASALIIVAGIVGLLWALSQFYIISRIPVQSGADNSGESEGLISSGDDEAVTKRLQEIYEAIYEGAESFLAAEYRVCFWFVVSFAVLIFILFFLPSRLARSFFLLFFDPVSYLALSF